MKSTTWPTDVRRYRWIVDGHNAIFSRHDLEELQIGNQKREARRRLEEILDRFAAAHGVDVQIVYDGNRMERNPDARRGGRVESVYSLAPEEEADDRIVMIANRWIREGKAVAVVTSDRATLGARLPGRVLRVDPAELFRRLDRPQDGERSREQRPPGDFSDIEAHFLAVESEGEIAKDSRAPRRGAARPVAVPKAPQKPAPVPPKPPAPRPERADPPPPDAAREAKRARGLRAQRRRLEQLRRGTGGHAGMKGDR